MEKSRKIVLLRKRTSLLNKQLKKLKMTKKEWKEKKVNKEKENQEEKERKIKKRIKKKIRKKDEYLKRKEEGNKSDLVQEVMMLMVRDAEGKVKGKRKAIKDLEVGQDHMIMKVDQFVNPIPSVIRADTLIWLARLVNQ